MPDEATRTGRVSAESLSGIIGASAAGDKLRPPPGAPGQTSAGR